MANGCFSKDEKNFINALILVFFHIVKKGKKFTSMSCAESAGVSPNSINGKSQKLNLNHF